mmetsp:Transcript_43430/g.76934  ORF Transcript_43430/g.76934 Transcript_43430/m.76934 type:complete len:126 (-) Transcript_43430:1218-1595(-)
MLEFVSTQSQHDFRLSLTCRAGGGPIGIPDGVDAATGAFLAEGDAARALTAFGAAAGVSAAGAAASEGASLLVVATVCPVAEAGVVEEAERSTGRFEVAAAATAASSPETPSRARISGWNRAHSM